MAQGDTMRTIFVTAVAILAMSAAAADLARVRAYPARLPAETSVYLGWSGFYIGALRLGARRSILARLRWRDLRPTPRSYSFRTASLIILSLRRSSWFHATGNAYSQ